MEAEGFEALISLAASRMRQGDFSEAIELAHRAHNLRPKAFYPNLILGQSSYAIKRGADACVYLANAARTAPRDAWVHFVLGKAFQMEGRDAAAVRAFSTALELEPDSLEILLALGYCQLGRGNASGGEEKARRVLGMDPKSISARLLLAGALILAGNSVEAKEQLREAVGLDSDGTYLTAIAIKQCALGEVETANATLRRAIELAPDEPHAYAVLFQTTRLKEQDRPLIEKLSNIMRKGAFPAELAPMLLALGKAYEDLGAYEEAMNQYDEANRISYQMKFGAASMDRPAYKDKIDRTIELFPPELFHSRALPVGEAAPPPVPVFIVGMIRSGTTLVEQILSSHPRIKAAGELPFWAQAYNELLEEGQIWTSDRIAELATEYRSLLLSFGPEAACVTDKMPRNYWPAGLIHLALPDARIVHVRRHPVDTCISIWATQNQGTIDFAHNRANIVFAYRQYVRLMDHWRAVLPADRLLEISYEELVTDRLRVTQRMVLFSGLEWDDSCLRPEENKRAVSTPSVWQVNQPVYNSSVGRRRKFEPWLREFGELMEHDGQFSFGR